LWYRLKRQRVVSFEAPIDTDIIAGTIGIDGQINWLWLGFCLYEVSLGENSRDSHLFIPYWSTVIPLTLLSAFMLLSKPRKSNPLKIVEPIPEKVA
jgi:hypothetical protein